jgi:predicted nucleic acid-binding protein
LRLLGVVPKPLRRIAATAMALGIPVVTQDDDYVDVPGLLVVHV